MSSSIPQLNERVGQLFQQGRYREAVSVARHVCDLARQHLGDGHPDTAESLNNLGCLLQALGDLAGARSSLEQSLAIRRKVLGEDHPHTATSLNNLGCLLYALRDLVGARPYYEQALAVRRKALGEENPQTSVSLNNLGNLLQTMGDLAGARPYYEQALEINRKVLGEDHPNTAMSLNDLGALLQSMGDLAGARPYLERALAATRKVLGEDHPDTATSYNNLGGLLRDMGNLVEARPYYERALAVWRRVLGEDHPQTAISLNNLGNLLRALGDLAEARPHLERALAICRKAVGEDHPHTSQSLNNLGNLLRAQGDLTGARPHLERALAICRKALGEDHPHTANTLNNLGDLLVTLGQEEQALPLLVQAAAIDDRVIGQVFAIGSDRQRAAILSKTQGNLAAFLSLVWGHLPESAEAVRRALDLVLRRKAILAEAQAAQRDAVLGGKYPRLLESLRSWSALRQQIARKILAGPGPEGPAAHHQQLAVWNSQRQRLEEELAREIPEMNLEQKLRAADRRAVALALPEEVALVEFVRFDVFDFRAVSPQGGGERRSARYLAFVLAAGEADAVRMIDLGEADPIDRLIEQFRAGVGEPPRARNMVRHPSAASPLPSEQAGAQLRAALFDPLVGALGERRQLLLSSDGGLCRLPFAVLPGVDGGLLMDCYQISYVNVGRDVLRFGVPTTGQPAEALVVADPDFDLGPPPSSGGFWSRLLGRRKPAAPPSRQTSRLWAQTSVGRHSRDLDRSCLSFGRLPGTRAEGERIAALLGVRAWLAGDVLEASLKQRCRSPRILHLATHGFFLKDQKHDPNQERPDPGLSLGEGRLSGPLPENPLLRSGLALAGANTFLRGGTLPDEAEDGLLTAEDVSGLDLLATELVVLSACETGLGEVRTGEGVFGLQRAFTLAGAKTLVMSLWSVPDEATRELMEDFYKRILAGEGRADALRHAQLALRQKYPDPYFWGAFICQGHPGPLATASFTPQESCND